MLSERAKSLKPSPTLALAAKAKELTAAGKDVISLSVGEPDWDTFESIKKWELKQFRVGQQSILQLMVFQNYEKR